MTDELRGKVAIVTGAASQIGIGRAIALAFVRAGARVTLADVDGENLDLTAQQAREIGGPDCVSTVVGSVGNPEDAERIVRQTLDRLGGLHVLVNNAGINPRYDAFWNLPVEHWNRTIGTNLSGPFFMARAAVGHLRAQGWGRIIGVTTSLDTMLHGIPYGPSKAGHEALLAAMAHDLKDSGVTANVLLPGRAVETHMVVPTGGPSHRLQPEVMQAPAVWLASSASDGCNGMRLTAEDWDASLPIEERVSKAMAPAGWPQLGRRKA